MLETNLALELGVFIEDALKDLRLPTKKEGVLRPPKVFDGYLPPKRSLRGKDEENDDFPFVVVRVDDGISERGMTTATVSLIVGCYTTETDGYAHCLEVVQRIRLALCQLENHTLNKRFQLVFPIEWNNVPEQPYPQWQLEMTTKWAFSTPELSNCTC